MNVPFFPTEGYKQTKQESFNRVKKKASLKPQWVFSTESGEII